MRVRTIRKHINGYPPVAEKSHGRKYEVPDDSAAGLIAAGVVEADGDTADE